MSYNQPQQLCLNVRATASGYIRAHYTFKEPGLKWVDTPEGSILAGTTEDSCNNMNLYVLASVVLKHESPSIWRASVFEEPVKLSSASTSYNTITYEILERSPRSFVDKHEIREERELNQRDRAKKAVIRRMLSTETLVVFSSKESDSGEIQAQHEQLVVVKVPDSTWDLL